MKLSDLDDSEAISLVVSQLKILVAETDNTLGSIAGARLRPSPEDTQKILRSIQTKANRILDLIEGVQGETSR